MAKFKVIKRYEDLEKKQTFNPNDEVEMTIKRSKEIEDKLGDGFLERIDDTDEKDDEKESE